MKKEWHSKLKINDLIVFCDRDANKWNLIGEIEQIKKECVVAKWNQNIINIPYNDIHARLFQ